MEEEHKIRLAAFRWLEEQTLFDDVISWHTLAEGFQYRERKVTLVGPQGIWWPKGFKTAPLTITTSPDSPYRDRFIGGLLHYAYRGTDPKHRDNAGLSRARAKQIPLIYFHGLMQGKYLAAWPVFIVAENPYSLFFSVAVDDKRFADNHERFYSTGADESRREYITATFKTRVHQRAFRLRVLEAYRSQCAICRLRHEELLDAAHIIPDSEPGGDPIVTNGLSLCKIHHAAFDRNFIGVSPDYEIVVKEELLEEKDGPMLLHGIQGVHGNRLILPKSARQRPDRDRLAQRFEVFRKAL